MVLETANGEQRTKPRIPTVAKLVTLSIVALSAGLAIPFIFVRRRHKLHAIPQSVNSSALGASPASLLARPSSKAVAHNSRLREQNQNREPHASSTAGSALFAFKALASATGIVAVTSTSLFFVAKWATGINELDEFTKVMRGVVGSRSHALQMRLQLWFGHRFPVIGRDSPAVEGSSEWNPEDAHKRLDSAWSEGGVMIWIAQTLEEWDAESAMEKERKPKKE